MGNYKKQGGDYYFNSYFNILEPTHFFHKPRIDKLFSFIPKNCSVLDAGCGSGILLYLLKDKKNCKISGFDINKNCVDFASKVCKTNSIKIADVRNFSNFKKFDVVVCSDVIEHFDLENQKKIISNLDKHVKQGGMIIITYPSFFYFKIIEKIWIKIRRKIYPNIIFDDEGFHNQVNMKNLFRQCKKLGYKIKLFDRYCYYFIDYLLLIKE